MEMTVADNTPPRSAASNTTRGRVFNGCAMWILLATLTTLQRSIRRIEVVNDGDRSPQKHLNIVSMVNSNMPQRRQSILPDEFYYEKEPLSHSPSTTDQHQPSPRRVVVADVTMAINLHS